MTLADHLDAINAMVSGEASPDDVGRMVLIALAKDCQDPAGCAARRLLGDCRRDIASEPSHPEAKFEFMPKELPVRRGSDR